MSSRKRRRGELDSYHTYSTSCAYDTGAISSYAPYRTKSSHASTSASVSSSRLLNLLDGKLEEDETPKAKRPRKGTKSNDPEAEPEKRAARFKKACPRNILDRVERVLTQRWVNFFAFVVVLLWNTLLLRFFMIERNRIGQELREEFGVLGSTGNVWADVPIYNTLHWQMTPGIHSKNWKATLLLLWVWR